MDLIEDLKVSLYNFNLVMTYIIHNLNYLKDSILQTLF